MTRPLALVTGAAHRLGKAFALALARQGYQLALHYHRSREQARQTLQEVQALSAPAALFQADLAQPQDIQALFDALHAQLPGQPPTLLVNSAALMPVGNPRTLPLADWDAALDLNLRAPFLLAQQAARCMPPGALIVNISDVAAQKTWSRYPSYTVSKAGLEALTRLLARAFAPDIRVNAIAPGLVLPSEVVTDQQWRALVERLPLQRAATLEEITTTLEFLIHNHYITGQTLVVDGGYSLL